MRRSPILGTVLLLGVLAVTARATAQESFVLSKGIDGTHIMPKVAVDPNTGNALAVWVTIDPDDSDIRTIWAAVLKRDKKGDFKAGKPREVAPGGTSANPVDNSSPEVIWSQMMKRFYVVWEAELPDGTQEIRGRRVKPKNGKPQGGVRVLAKNGSVNSSPAVDSLVANGRASTYLAYIQRPASGARTTFQVMVRELKKNGKPRGKAESVHTLDQSFAFLSQVFVVDPSGPVRPASPAGAAILTGAQLVVVGPVDDDDTLDEKCFLQLVIDGQVVDTEEVDQCVGFHRVSPTTVVVLTRGDNPLLALWSELLYEVTPNETIREAAFDGGTFSGFVEYLFAEEARYFTGDRSMSRRVKKTDVLAFRRDDGRTFVEKIDPEGNTRTFDFFNYYGATRGMDAAVSGEKPVSPDRAIGIWIGRTQRFDAEEVRASIIRLR